MARIVEQLRNPAPSNKEFVIADGRYHKRFGVISDTHFGSIHFAENVFDQAVKVFNKEKVDAVLHSGDVVDGMGGFEGFYFEINKFGYHEQIKYAVEQLKRFNSPLVFTTGNHDGWAKKKSNIGYLVGPDIESKIKGSKFLGEMTGDIALNDKVKIRLTHEGNSCYALSYTGQKRINALEGGKKPSVILNGHIHKALYMFYRNIHYFEAGCLQKQTTFMREKGSPAMVGFWVIDLWYSKNSIMRMRPTFYPHY
jgi:predicted phosphodiesterase